MACFKLKKGYNVFLGSHSEVKLRRLRNSVNIFMTYPKLIAKTQRSSAVFC